MAADDEPPAELTAKDLAAAFARASARRAPTPAPDGDAPPEEELDPQTRADLERWFGLPSYQELAERPPEPQQPVDEDLKKLLAARARALAAIDPALLERHRRRVEPDADRVLPRPLPELRTYADPDMTMFDQSALGHGHSIAEPREVEIPQQLIDDLHECTPQAILRDLHRPEDVFDKVFEIVDHGRELVVDVGHTVAELMRQSFRATAQPSTFTVGCALYGESRVVRSAPWVDVLKTYLPNRREGLS
ncbi:MAG: hypothetical protein KIT31_38920 [Deltaproteobacteria bacterium]|nr:hypothetical protein [Deltaproteobacteria bacterium]